MNHSLVLQTTVIDPADTATLQRALETKNVSFYFCFCKFFFLNFVFHVKYLLCLEAFLSWFLVSFFSIYPHQLTFSNCLWNCWALVADPGIVILLWVAYQSLLAVYWCGTGFKALPCQWSTGLHRWDICNACEPAGIGLGGWSCTPVCNQIPCWSQWCEWRVVAVHSLWHIFAGNFLSKISCFKRFKCCQVANSSVVRYRLRVRESLLSQI